MKWIVAGGGTGGHFFPAFEFAKALVNNGDDVLFIGVKRGIESKLLPGTGLRYTLIEFEGVRGRGLRGILSLLKLPFAIISVVTTMAFYKAEAVFLTGGYASIPVAIGALIMGLPIVLHEQNSIPGLASLIIARFADVVLVTFSESSKFFRTHKIVHTGNIIREDFFRVRYSSRVSPFTVFVVGGSLGARRINQVFCSILPLLKKLNVRIFHQTGKYSYDEVNKEYSRIGYEYATVEEFFSKPWEILQNVSLVVSRCGSGSISELVVAGKVAVLIPYPYAVSDHQYYNALYVSKMAPFVVIREVDLEGTLLYAFILKFYLDRRLLASSTKYIKGSIPVCSGRRLLNIVFSEIWRGEDE